MKILKWMIGIRVSLIIIFIGRDWALKSKSFYGNDFFPVKYEIIFNSVPKNYPKLNLTDWNFKQFRGGSSSSDE